MELDNEKKVTDYLEFALKIKNQKDFVFLLKIGQDMFLKFRELEDMQIIEHLVTGGDGYASFVVTKKTIDYLKLYYLNKLESLYKLCYNM